MNEELVRKMITRKPLLIISMWSQIQADNLIDIGQDVSRRISKILKTTGKVDKGFNKAYGYLSLWIFGAYEMIRTLDQNSARLNDETKKRVKAYKKRLSQIRVPLAKQELASNKGRVNLEPAVVDVDFENKDFVFQINGESYKFKDLFKEYKELIASITIDSFQDS